MAQSPPDPANDLARRVQWLEGMVRVLQGRIVALETQLGVRRDRPDDQATVAQKVTYDWQK
ncbi:MAG: hypothetical protein AAFA34_05535 [Thermoplasmata archaeon]|jgi:hypothetical protein